MRIRVVPDTNVYIAAALKPGGPTEIWLRIAGRPSSTFELFASDPILAELREKLVGKFHFSKESVDSFESAIRETATIVEPTTKLPSGVVSDPDDEKILECAIEATAQLMISADRDLLSLNPFQSIGIAHPRELKNIFKTDLREN